MTNVLMLYSGAVTLGALHAFEPGHGKTLIGAYMIGTKGRARDGLFLGAIVTVTHTFSVVLLGLAAKILSKTYSEEILHNWLGFVSAGIILVVGVWILRQRLSSNAAHHHLHLFGKSHSHEHPHEHSHVHKGHDNHHTHGDTSDHTNKEPHEHSHEHHDHSVEYGKKKAKNKWELFMLGVSGGIIPCPAAIATLLAAIAAGKIAQGLSVTLFFSLGLGIVMMSIGAALSQTGRLTEKVSENLELSRKLGIVSGVLIVLIGSYTMFHSVKGIWLS
ncbi:MAG: high frequency lysogenization protein HflD [Candidatus Electrothrix sp. AR4]|nr:high frequency lysogenization protein HflD [Candidatus Electrothrix sp. AR4]